MNCRLIVSLSLQIHSTSVNSLSRFCPTQSICFQLSSLFPKFLWIRLHSISKHERSVDPKVTSSNQFESASWICGLSNVSLSTGRLRPTLRPNSPNFRSRAPEHLGLLLVVSKLTCWIDLLVRRPHRQPKTTPHPVYRSLKFEVQTEQGELSN